MSAEQLAYSLPGALASLHSDGQWQYAPHFKAIEDKLLDVASGKIKRLMVSMPPQHGKSTLISQYFTAWFLGRNPNKKVILSSYEANFAASWGRTSRGVLEDLGETVFGVKVNPNVASNINWEVTPEFGIPGAMRTAGAGGPITGKGADLFIIDDPIKNHEDAQSQVLLQKVWDWYVTTVLTRMSPTGAIIIVMTRWSYEDICGKLLKAESEDWEVLSLPALAEENDPLGRKQGEPLWPERYDGKYLEKIKKTQGSYWWEAMYQQRPTPAGGGLIKMEWFKRYGEVPANPDQIIISFDTAQKETEVNDYSVCGVWFIVNNNYYLVDLIRDRYTHPRLIALAKNIITKYSSMPYKGINAVLIEDKASGISLIQHLKEETSANVIGINPENDKVIRMQNETPAIEAGRVFLPEAGKSHWLIDFEIELMSFPRSPHKDQVDMTSQFLKWARERGGSGIDMW